MTDFKMILDKAKELEAKMKESQEKIKNIKVEGISGSNSVKIILDGEGEMQKIEISDEINWVFGSIDNFVSPNKVNIEAEEPNKYDPPSPIYIDAG